MFTKLVSAIRGFLFYLSKYELFHNHLLKLYNFNKIATRSTIFTEKKENCQGWINYLPLPSCQSGHFFLSDIEK